LLPKDQVNPPIKIPIDPDVVKIVRQMSVPETDQISSECMMGENLDAPAQKETDLALFVESGSSDEDDCIVRALENMNEIGLDDEDLTESEAAVTNANVEIDGLDSNSLVSVGLLNRDGSCYVNAFLQVLFHVSPLRSLILRLGRDDPLLRRLRSIFSEMARGNLICPADIGMIVEPDRQGDKDCCEFGSNLLNAVLARVDDATLMSLQDLICFQIVRTLSAYGEQGQVMEPPEIILRISSGCDSLMVGIDMYFSQRPSVAIPNVIENLSIVKLAKFLFIQIDRMFVVNGAACKDCRSLVFDLVLDLNRFEIDASIPAVYDLSSVITHIGIPNQGICHYAAFCKVGNSWFCFNDSYRGVQKFVTSPLVRRLRVGRSSP
jgi:hypothetical protein